MGWEMGCLRERADRRRDDEPGASLVLAVASGVTIAAGTCRPRRRRPAPPPREADSSSTSSSPPSCTRKPANSSPSSMSAAEAVPRAAGAASDVRCDAAACDMDMLLPPRCDEVTAAIGAILLLSVAGNSSSDCRAPASTDLGEGEGGGGALETHERCLLFVEMVACTTK